MMRLTFATLAVCLGLLTTPAAADPEPVRVGFDRLPSGDPPQAGRPLGDQFERAGVRSAGPGAPLLLALPVIERGSRPFALGGREALSQGFTLILVDPQDPEQRSPRAEVTVDILSLGASKLRVEALGKEDDVIDSALIDGTLGQLVLVGPVERIDGPDGDVDLLGLGYRDRVHFRDASIYGLRITLLEAFDGDAVYIDDLVYARDTCPEIDNEDQLDTDSDGLGDACDDDLDGDDVPNEDDNCPRHPNADQNDHDLDGLGDVCSPDADDDGIPRDHNGDGVVDNPCRGGLTEDCDDNCPLHPNPDQRDSDLDGLGNICDPDQEGDGVPNDEDNCPETTNPDQIDSDDDGLGDLCDDDDDGDGVQDISDNCRGVYNPDQENLDLDRMGDACDDDDDNDTWDDHLDNCPRIANTDQQDTDFDGLGDACDDDADNDGALDEHDNCPQAPNPEQADLDGDGTGDICDVDDDGDDVDDLSDNCPTTPNSDQKDTDGDNQGDACDDDPDGDTFVDDDNCPLAFNPGQEDTDGNGIGDACDRAPDAQAEPDCGCRPVAATRLWQFWRRR
jgi:hypothetical protein